MTTRKRIIELIKHESLTLREISKTLGIPEKEAAKHLPHIQISVKVEGLSLEIDPCTCLSCGYIFKERKRFTRPGRCPACRGERIEEALFSIILK